MAQPIARIYETAQRARDAAAKLREEGFPQDTIFLVTPGGEGDAGSAALSRAIALGHLLGERARTYADHVRQDHSLVAISAPFGFGQQVVNIMESFGPLETRFRSEGAPARSVGWDTAAPLSSALQARVLLRDRPAPLSSSLGFETISHGRSFQSWFRELTSPHLFMSSFVGQRLIKHHPTPLSSLFGLRTIVSPPSGPAWKTSFGLSLLSEEPTPLSSRLGFRVLIHERAPLSKRLGLPVLTRNQR